MKSSPQTIQNQLAKQIAPVYLVSGDEPLQHMETCDAIRQAARERGFNEREIFHVDKQFDWSVVFASTRTMSLFSQLRLIELRLGSGKLGDKGGKAFVELLNDLPQDTVILVICAKLDAATQRTKWYKSLEAVGVTVQIWPVETNRLPAWIQERMQKKGLRPSREAVQVLAERGEGNLLAIAQEIEKLCLLATDTEISAEDVIKSVADSARFDIYGFVDDCLRGDARRIVRILNGLQTEGVEAILVLWVLTREIRNLAIMSRALQNGASVDQIIAKFKVWPKRKALIRTALNRQKPEQWEAYLGRASLIDRAIKGLEAGKVWDQLLQLCLDIAGLRLFAQPRVAP